MFEYGVILHQLFEHVNHFFWLPHRLLRGVVFMVDGDTVVSWHVQHYTCARTRVNVIIHIAIHFSPAMQHSYCAQKHG